MVQITVKIEGAEVVRQGLEEVIAEVPRMGRLRIFKKMSKALRRVKIYPPERAGQTYVRTFKFQRNWRLVKASPMSYRLFNRARTKGRLYPQFVIGDSKGLGQAWMHAGRWYLFRFLIDELVEELWIEWQEDIDELISRTGLAT